MNKKLLDVFQDAPFRWDNRYSNKYDGRKSEGFIFSSTSDFGTDNWFISSHGDYFMIVGEKDGEYKAKRKFICQLEPDGSLDMFKETWGRETISIPKHANMSKLKERFNKTYSLIPRFEETRLFANKAFVFFFFKN